MQKILTINGKDFLIMDMNAVNVQVCEQNGDNDTHIGNYISDMMIDEFYRDGVYARCDFEWYERPEGMDRDSLNFIDSAIGYYGIRKIAEDECANLSRLQITRFTAEFFKSLSLRLLERASEETIEDVTIHVLGDLFSKVEAEQ